MTIDINIQNVAIAVFVIMFIAIVIYTRRKDKKKK